MEVYDYVKSCLKTNRYLTLVGYRVVALKGMKNGNAMGPDVIPVEVWKSLGEEGVDMLLDLLEKHRRVAVRFHARTTDAIFAARQVMEKHREMQKELHMVSIGLEKVCRCLS